MCVQCVAVFLYVFPSTMNKPYCFVWSWSACISHKSPVALCGTGLLIFPTRPVALCSTGLLIFPTRPVALCGTGLLIFPTRPVALCGTGLLIFPTRPVALVVTMDSELAVMSRL